MSDRDEDPANSAVVTPFPTARERASLERSDRERADRRTTQLRHVIGEVLREERLRQGRTLREVADQAAVSLPYLSEIERGRKEVSSDLLAAVNRSLDLQLADVLERATQRLRAGSQRFDRPVLLAA